MVPIQRPTPFSILLRVARQFTATIQGRIGFLLIGMNVVIFVVGPYLAPYDPIETGVGPSAEAPSPSHLLGTDTLGRDILSRFLHGGATILFVPLAAVTLAFLIGGALGMASGYIGGLFGNLVARLLDVTLPIPPLLVALVVIARFGGQLWVMVAIVAAVYAPRIARILRAAVQNLTTMEYVLAAEARGESQTAIIFGEIIPNILAPLLVEYGMRLNFAVSFISSLNFLGLGVQPPSSNWALMVSESTTLIPTNPAGALAPMLGLTSLVVGINFLMDSLTQYLSDETSRV
ncbi:MAG TPA: ABC transporter permease [Acidobacteriota bacterium]